MWSCRSVVAYVILVLWWIILYYSPAFIHSDLLSFFMLKILLVLFLYLLSRPDYCAGPQIPLFVVFFFQDFPGSCPFHLSPTLVSGCSTSWRLIQQIPCQLLKKRSSKLDVLSESELCQWNTQIMFLKRSHGFGNITLTSDLGYPFVMSNSCLQGETCSRHSAPSETNKENLKLSCATPFSCVLEALVFKCISCIQ